MAAIPKPQGAPCPQCHATVCPETPTRWACGCGAYGVLCAPAKEPTVHPHWRDGVAKKAG